MPYAGFGDRSQRVVRRQSSNAYEARNSYSIKALFGLLDENVGSARAARTRVIKSFHGSSSGVLVEMLEDDDVLPSFLIETWPKHDPRRPRLHGIDFRERSTHLRHTVSNPSDIS